MDASILDLLEELEDLLEEQSKMLLATTVT